VLLTSILYDYKVMAARTVGPAFGYMLGSAMLAIYADPANTPPGLIDTSPNWIGAWWMGFFIIGKTDKF
jgi:hypothetical protein